MQIELNDSGDAALRLQVLEPLAAHNAEMTGRRDPGGRVAVVLRDATGAIEGGMYASYWQTWMKLELAFLPEARRGGGLGARMLATLEHAAIGLGCRGVWTNSFSVQAPGFYEKQGYRVVGVLKDRPIGHEDVFLAKDGGLGTSPATMVVEFDADPAIGDAIGARLRAFTDTKAGPGNSRPLAILVRDEAGAVIGGLWGRTARGWLYVDLFGLPKTLRGTGLGTRLLRMAEQEARVRGCIGIWLDTFSFQARPFYEKLGLSVFGQIDNFPEGHTRFFLSRRLDG